MIKYKLTDQKMQTYGKTQWVLEEKKTIANPGRDMCSSQVFHYYHSPEQAVLFNPIHADIKNPRLFEVEADAEVANDGLKGTCHEMTLIKELPLPVLTTEQRVTFAIKCALKVCQEPKFVGWAENWLSGKNRSEEGAWAAARAVRATAAAAEAAAAEVAAVRAADSQINFQEIIEEVLSK